MLHGTGSGTTALPLQKKPAEQFPVGLSRAYCAQYIPGVHSIAWLDPTGQKVPKKEYSNESTYPKQFFFFYME